VTLFSYTVKDKTGKTHKKMGNYPTREVLIDFLQKKGFFIVDITETSYTKSSKKQTVKKEEAFSL